MYLFLNYTLKHLELNGTYIKKIESITIIRCHFLASAGIQIILTHPSNRDPQSHRTYPDEPDPLL